MADKRKKRATVAKGRAKAAEAVIAEVEAEGDEGEGYGTAQERAERNVTIYRSAMRGVHPTTLGATYGLSERQVRRVIANQRNGVKQIALAKADPTAALEDYVWHIDGVIDELASTAAREKGSARVAAIMGRLTALKERRAVLQSAGILPEDLRVLKQVDALVQIGQTIVEIFDRYKVPDEAAAEIGRLLDPENTIEGTAAEITDGNAR